MRKFIVLLLLTLIILTKSTQAQDTATIDIGFQLVPQAGLNLKDGKSGFSSSIPLYAAISYTKGNFGICPFYCFTENSIGFFPSYQITHSIGVYGVYSKNIVSDGNYVGVGMGFNVANGNAQGFIEFGSSYTTYTPTIYTGVFIPLMFGLKLNK